MLLTLRAHAAEPWRLPLFTADPKSVLAAASKYTAPDRSDGITIEYSVLAQLDEAGRMHQTTRSISRVLRVQGIESARRVMVSWIPWRENRPKLRVRVITSDGNPHVLDEAALNESGSPDGSGPKILSAFLPDAEVDSVVETEIDESDREPVYPGGRLGEIVLDSKFPISRFQAVIESPSTPQLHVETRGFGEVKRTATPSAEKQHVVMEASNILPGQNARFLPPEVTPAPTITFSNVPSWQALAQWYATVFAKGMPAQSATHPAPPTDPVSAVEAAFEEMRKKVRDKPMDFGSVPYAPRSPAETLASGTADSKDAALLLMSKLTEIGIASKAALVSAAPAADVLPGAPGIEAFNRVLVYVPGQQPLWIDPSAELTPVSRLPESDQAHWALIVDPSATTVVRTPDSTATENRQIQRTEIRIRDGSDPIVTSTIEAFGAFADALRPALHEFAAAAAQEQEQLRLRFAQFTRSQRVTAIDVGEPSKLLKPCTLHVTAEGYGGLYVGDESGFIDLPGATSLGLQRLATLFGARDANQTDALDGSSRKEDYYLPPPFTEEEHYHVIPPAGYRLKEPAPMPPVTLGALTVNSAVKLEADGSFSLTYAFVNPKSRYSVREVSAMRGDAAKLPAAGPVRVVFTNIAEERLANGELKEGITLLRRTAASEPVNINAILRLANAYVDAGAGPEAIKVCHDALSKNKESAAAYARLGWVYGHDEFGRALRPGMNMAEAEKAYLKAIDLDPDQSSYVLQLATLYTYGPVGIRYGASANLEQALRMYRRLGIDALARAGALNDYAAALLFARKYDEVRRLFLYPQAESAEAAIKLAAIAATGTVSDVVNEANYLFPAANMRRIQLIEAGRYLLNSRNYGPAAMLFQTAGAAVQGSLGVDLETLRGTKVMDESAISKQPAIAAFQRFTAATLNPGDPAAWAKLLAPEARDVPLEKYRLALLQILPATQTLFQQPVAWPWVADLLATSISLTAEGNDQAGYRIRAAGAAKAPSKTLAYVVKQGADYLILGLSGTGQTSGEALTKVESGDVANARLWLDWAKEEIGSGKPADPFSTPALASLWPAKSQEPVSVRAAAAAIAAQGPQYTEGIKQLNEVRQQISDAGMQTIVDAGLAQALLRHEKYADAAPVLQRLAGKWPNSESVRYALIQALIYSNQYSEAASHINELSRTEGGALPSMRLRATLLTQQGKLKEAADLEAQICANPKSSALDWNSLAWIGLFVSGDPKVRLRAAEKADELTRSGNPEVLHTLALVMASDGDLKDARATAYRLMDGIGNSDELFTIFGRIAEELELRDVAANYYKRVKKPDGSSTLSLYSFALMRLKSLPPAAPATVATLHTSR